jgi:hypothetical protein
MDNKAEETKELVQQKIVDLITEKLENGEMSAERAKQIAKHVLEQLPDNVSYQKLMEIVPKLDDHFQELSVAIVPIMIEYERQMKVVIDQKIKQLLEANKLDAALDITKKAIEFEKSFT